MVEGPETDKEVNIPRREVHVVTAKTKSLMLHIPRSDRWPPTISATIRPSIGMVVWLGRDLQPTHMGHGWILEYECLTGAF